MTNDERIEQLQQEYIELLFIIGNSKIDTRQKSKIWRRIDEIANEIEKLKNEKI